MTIESNRPHPTGSHTGHRHYRLLEPPSAESARVGAVASQGAEPQAPKPAAFLKKLQIDGERRADDRPSERFLHLSIVELNLEPIGDRDHLPDHTAPFLGYLSQVLTVPAHQEGMRPE